MSSMTLGLGAEAERTQVSALARRIAGGDGFPDGALHAFRYTAVGYVFGLHISLSVAPVLWSRAMSNSLLFNDISTQMDVLRELGRLARTLMAGGGADGSGFRLYQQLEGACVSAVDALRRHELPSFVVEVVAARTVLACAKDYAVHGFSERAFTLLLERPECATTSHRVALLGVGSQSRAGFDRTRNALTALTSEPHVVALDAAMEVLDEGSREAGEELLALAVANPAGPSILWLAEVAAQAMGDGPRFQKTRRALDDLLESAAFGSGAYDAASFMRYGRTQLGALGSQLAEAWDAAAPGDVDRPRTDPNGVDPKDAIFGSGTGKMDAEAAAWWGKARPLIWASPLAPKVRRTRRGSPGVRTRRTMALRR